jgi:hypothetical protein
MAFCATALSLTSSVRGASGFVTLSVALSAARSWAFADTWRLDESIWATRRKLEMGSVMMVLFSGLFLVSRNLARNQNRQLILELERKKRLFS